MQARISNARAISFAQPTLYFKGTSDEDHAVSSLSSDVTSSDSNAEALRCTSFNVGGHYVKHSRRVPMDVKLSCSSYGVDEADLGIDLEREILRLPHNAIRKEMCGINVMVASAYHRGESVTRREVDEFYSWFDVFESLLLEYFDYEENVLFRWCEDNGVTVPLTQRTSARKTRRQQIFAVSAEISRTQWQSGFSSTFSRLFDLTEQLCSVLLEYFAVQEDTLGLPIRSACATEASKNALRRAWLDFGRSSREPGRFLACTLRCLARADDRKRFEGEWISRTASNPFGRHLTRSKLLKSRRRFISSHVQTVNGFYVRFVAYQQNVPLHRRMPLANTYA
eukprot:CAMPEP_0198355058 /NCGR_PEP_ID=MMETSP1450-20131203/117716_1 /TAXON_ID=753684 ORGANISM="Madagascaria erythrocladiodes, Strain CCMP3234" /NCGR_SAMPLE_ID=MMETSP1450 /ASSEMBLY_ACC=CAM_ASM_001115 /LENGTH=337 /DNA_ID=CAMNT_0044061391 /DNA_START=148 /DNA_END=1161 /DNA_ORIENTATION=+